MNVDCLGSSRPFAKPSVDKFVDASPSSLDNNTTLLPLLPLRLLLPLIPLPLLLPLLPLLLLLLLLPLPPLQPTAYCLCRHHLMSTH